MKMKMIFAALLGAAALTPQASVAQMQPAQMPAAQAPASMTPAPAAPAANLPTADSILQRYVDVTGGTKAYESVKTMKATGKFAMAAQGITGDLSLYQLAPDKSYAVIDIQGVGKMEQGSDGSTVWEISPITGARIKTGAEAANEIRSGATDIHTNWRKYYKSEEVTGMEDVGGKANYKLVLTPKEGGPETQWYEKDSGLLTKSNMVVDTPMGQAPVDMMFTEYRKEGDLSIPTKLSQSVAGQQIEITLEKIDFNTPIADTRFDLPAEIKALKK